MESLPPEKVVADDLRRLATDMENVAFALRTWGLGGTAKQKAAELKGAAKMARQWAKEVAKDARKL